MSIATETSEITYTGNGATVAFPVTFGWQANSQVVVRKKDTTGANVWVTQVEGVDYTLTGSGSPPASGTVTMTVAPPAMHLLWIYRDVTFTQPTAFRTAGNFSAARHENAFDYLTFQTQELARRLAVVEAGAQVLSAYTAIQVTKQWTTHATAVESGFPLNVAMPAGTSAIGARVVRIQNITSPSTLFYEPVDISGWTQTGDNLVLNYVTGLDVATEYLMRIEVLK